MKETVQVFVLKILKSEHLLNYLLAEYLQKALFMFSIWVFIHELIE